MSAAVSRSRPRLPPPLRLAPPLTEPANSNRMKHVCKDFAWKLVPALFLGLGLRARPGGRGRSDPAPSPDIGGDPGPPDRPDLAPGGPELRPADVPG